MIWYNKETNEWIGFCVYVSMPEGYKGMIVDDIDEACCMMEQVWAIKKGWA